MTNVLCPKKISASNERFFHFMPKFMPNNKTLCTVTVLESTCTSKYRSCTDNNRCWCVRTHMSSNTVPSCITIQSKLHGYPIVNNKLNNSVTVPVKSQLRQITSCMARGGQHARPSHKHCKACAKHAHAPRPRVHTGLHDFHLVEFSYQPVPSQ